MKKKMALVLAAVMLLTMGLCAPMAQATEATEETNLVQNGGFEDALNSAPSNIALSGSASIVTIGGAKEGFNYLSMPGASDGFTVNLKVEGETNYVLSFWAKTSIANSLNVKMYPYVSYNGGWYDWSAFCSEMQAVDSSYAYIGVGEGHFDFNTGLTAAEGGEWLENKVEFRAPHHCTNVVLYFAPNESSEDAFRMVDDVRVVKKENNLILNGDFSGKKNNDISTYNETTTVVTEWNFYPSEHYNGKIAYVNDNGNEYYQLKATTGDYRGVGIVQVVYLYPGTYEFSYRMLQKSGDNNMIGFINTDAAHTDFIPDRVYMGTRPFIATEDWRYYKTYFTVYQAGGYTLRFGNCWYHGDWAYDDVKIVPREEGRVHLGTGISTYTDANSGNETDVQYTPVETLTAGQTVAAFGSVPSAEGVTAGKVITAIYKTSDKGTMLMGVAMNDAVPGNAFIGSGITVPELEEGETLSCKVMFWDSFGNMQTLSDSFNLQ